MTQYLIEYFTQSWTEYYLTDLLGTILILWSMYLLAQKKRIGFITNFIASVLWVIWHFEWGSPAGMVMNVALCIINAYGWTQWKRK